jgi:hypothetical protein
MRLEARVMVMVKVKVQLKRIMRRRLATRVDMNEILKGS